MANENDPGNVLTDMHQLERELSIRDLRYRVPELPLASMERTRRESFGYAETLFKPLMKQIKEFETKLTPDEEVGAYLASFGKEVLIHIDDVTFKNPHLMVFRGTMQGSGHRVELLQHTSQMSVLLVAVPKQGKVARRIGFGDK